MGAGAGTGIAVALKAASPQELEATLTALSLDARAKLRTALLTPARATSMTLEPWPEKGHEEWVRRLLLREQTVLDDVVVQRLSSGLNNASFRVTSKNGQAYVFCRSRYPKHRAWAYYNRASALGLAPKVVFQKYDMGSGQSLEMTEMAQGKELMSVPTYLGMGEGVRPDAEMIAKCGRLLARLHKMDTSWHADFANEAVADLAGIPKKKEGEPCDVYDPAEGFIQTVMTKFVTRVLNDARAKEIDCDKAYIVSESNRILTHPILPTGGLLSRTKMVSSHGDYHTSNIVTHNNEPLAIDFEMCFVGPAGYDVACLYEMAIRCLSPEHNYDQVASYAKAYVDELGNTMAVDDFIFDMIAWNYFFVIKGAILAQAMGSRGAASSESLAYSAQVLHRSHLEAYCERMVAARHDDEARARIVRTGRVVN